MGVTTKSPKKKKLAWGITGGGDKIEEIVKAMNDIREKYESSVEIHVFLSKAAELVLKFYGLEGFVRQHFAKIAVEVNSNTPFLAALMQTRKYEFLLIAPASSNTVAKIAHGISDSMLSNAAIMSLKAFVPVYVLPTDYKENVVFTKLPDGTEMKLRVRKEDAENTRKLEKMEGLFVIEDLNRMPDVFSRYFSR